MMPPANSPRLRENTHPVTGKQGSFERRYCEAPQVLDLFHVGLSTYGLEAAMADPHVAARLGYALALRPGVVLFETLKEIPDLRGDHLRAAIVQVYDEAIPENWGFELPPELDPMTQAGLEAPPDALLWADMLLEVRDGRYVEPMLPVPAEDLTAERFAESEQARNLRFCAETNSWMAWDDHRWKLAPDTMTKVRRALSAYLMNEEIPLWDQLEGREYRKYTQRLLSSTGQKAVLELVQWKLTANRADMDTDPMALNTPGGILEMAHPDPKTGIYPLTPHDHQLVTKVTRANYDPNATCPLWLRFVDEVMLGRQDYKWFLQKAAGYTLSGLTREDAAFFPIGGGRNGKGVFLGTISGVMGDYASTTREALIMSTGREADHSLATLFGVRLAWIDEVKPGSSINTSALKRMTGGGALPVRGIYEKEWSFAPHFKLWVSANSLATVADNSPGFWARVKPIPFEASWLGREDRGLRNKLIPEYSGILNWLLQGLRGYLSEGLALPEGIQVEHDEYRQGEDAMAQFLEACIEKAAIPGNAKEAMAARIPSHQLRKVYTAWASALKLRVPGNTELGRQFKAHGLEIHNSNGRYIEGYRWTPEGRKYLAIGGSAQAAVPGTFKPSTQVGSEGQFGEGD